MSLRLTHLFFPTLFTLVLLGVGCGRGTRQAEPLAERPTKCADLASVEEVRGACGITAANLEFKETEKRGSFNCFYRVAGQGYFQFKYAPLILYEVQRDRLVSTLAHEPISGLGAAAVQFYNPARSDDRLSGLLFESGEDTVYMEQNRLCSDDGMRVLAGTMASRLAPLVPSAKTQFACGHLILQAQEIGRFCGAPHPERWRLSYDDGFTPEDVQNKQISCYVDDREDPTEHAVPFRIGTYPGRPFNQAIQWESDMQEAQGQAGLNERPSEDIEGLGARARFYASRAQKEPAILFVQMEDLSFAIITGEGDDCSRDGLIGSARLIMERMQDAFAGSAP